MPLGTATILALALLLPASQPDDLRIALAELQLGRDAETALHAVEAALAEGAESARILGLDYLHGHLLQQTERRQEALEAFVASMSATPVLSTYGRFRLAQEQIARGEQKVAAGLLATLLGSNPPKALILPGLRLLQSTIEAGGDCRLVRGLADKRFTGTTARHLAMIQAICGLRGSEPAVAEQGLFRLIEANQRDDIARQAGNLLLVREANQRTAREHMLLGLTFHNHREFDLAIQHLAQAVARVPESRNISRRELFDMRYALARSHFWQERYTVAAAAFSALASATAASELRSQVRYQQGRCLELAGEWPRAIEIYRAAYAAAPGGGWVDSALMGQLRLHWRRGHEDEALRVFDELVRRRRLTSEYRALLFFAASDLVQGRGDRAGSWLTNASRLNRGPRTEVSYWMGRNAELANDPGKAVEHYLGALREKPHDPFAIAARERLGQGAVGPTAQTLGRRLARSSRNEDLYNAWLLLGDVPDGRKAWKALWGRLHKDVLLAPFLDLSLRPPATWPLWQAPLGQAEEMLLALGIWEEGASVVLRHFPVAEPNLAYTGSLLLAQAGETRRSLYIAEILRKRVPKRLPEQLLPRSFRRLLFPFRYSYLILRESDRRGVDPYLLAGIIREESRFDPRAFSGAAARGLTQFIMPTAERIGNKIELGPVVPEDLERPEVSIALGAAYLQDLAARFGGNRAIMVAAYNAGEPQADLWRRYCFSDDPAEFYTKVTFRETRNYVLKVLTSYAQYIELFHSTSDREAPLRPVTRQPDGP